jgi:hypothetical protein
VFLQRGGQVWKGGVRERGICRRGKDENGFHCFS